MNQIRNPDTPASPSADELVALMAEAGTPPNLLAAIARALFAGEEGRRALDARLRSERARKLRARGRFEPETEEAEGSDGQVTARDVTGESVTARDVTGQHVPARDVPSHPSPNKSPPDPQKLTPNPCERDPRASGRARGSARPGYHRLPEGWRPTRPLPLRTQAKVDQWPPGAIEDELAKLHLWAANAKDEQGRGRKLDWDKAWAKWIERRHDEHFRRTGSGAAGAAGYQARHGGSATMRAADRVFGPLGAGDGPPFPY